MIGLKVVKYEHNFLHRLIENYDYEAADELFSNWKDRQEKVNQTADNEKQQRKDAIKAASTGNARGSGEKSSKKIYRRSDIIKLMKEIQKDI